MTIDCEISQKLHRTIMGAKGSNVQAITQEHNVSIKFPERNRDRDTAHGATGAPAENGDVGEGGEGEKEVAEVPKSRDIIKITGRLENAAAAKQALLVRPNSPCGCSKVVCSPVRRRHTRC